MNHGMEHGTPMMKLMRDNTMKIKCNCGNAMNPVFDISGKAQNIKIIEYLCTACMNSIGIETKLKDQEPSIR
jgi:hypothetical protein